MATIRRAGFGTIFELEDSKVGIGTDAATHTLQALGNIRSEAATDIGISSLTTYQGFTDKEARFTTGQIDNQSQSGSTSGEIVIDGNVTVSSATTFTSGPQNLTVTDTFTLPSGDTNSRTLKPTAGSLRFNQDFATLEFYTGNNWATVNTFTEMQNSPGSRGRALFGGGQSPASQQVIDFVNIATAGNAKNFGELTSAKHSVGSASNEIRGLYAGEGPSSVTDDIDFITIASGGGAIDFGNLTSARRNTSGVSSSSRGIFAAGATPSNTNVIDYIEFMTLGNALDFGDTIVAQGFQAACQSPTRGVIGGTGTTSPFENSFITIASKGNAVRFGEPNVRRRSYGGASNSVRGLFGGGVGDPSPATFRSVEFITISSEGNGVEFGDLFEDKGSINATASQTRVLFAGGSLPSTKSDLIESLTIASSGNSIDFGNLSIARSHASALSDSHGGLGGF